MNRLTGFAIANDVHCVETIQHSKMGSKQRLLAGTRLCQLSDGMRRLPCPMAWLNALLVLAELEGRLRAAKFATPANFIC